MDTRIEIAHYDCKKQKVVEIVESFVELTPFYLRYRVHGYIQQWDDGLDILKSEPTEIDDDEYVAPYSIGGVYLHKTQDTLSYIIEIFYLDRAMWIRFKKESEARKLLNAILEWTKGGRGV